MPSKPRMPIPTSALLRPNVTGKPTEKSCWVWFPSSVSEISFRYESFYANLNLDLTPPFVAKNLYIIQVTWSYCSHSHHHLGLQQNTEKCGGSKNALVLNQVADGQRDGLLLLQKRFLSKGNLFFFALKQPYQMSKQIWQMLLKEPFAVNFFKCLWLLALFSSQCMACLISLTTAPFCFGETRQQMTSWSKDESVAVMWSGCEIC